jgi:hypothetical protein
MLGPDVLVALDLGPRLVRNQFRDDTEEARSVPDAAQPARSEDRGSVNPVRWLLRLTPATRGR